MADYKVQKFPKTRIATNDVCEIGKQKHHIGAMLEMDVSTSREKVKKYKNEINQISFTAWLIKAISLTIKDFENVASYLDGIRKIIIFNDINISMIVEKEYMGQKIPIPLIINKANERSIESITKQIEDAKNSIFTEKDIILQNKTSKLEKLYFLLPGFIRRYFWKYLLKHPHIAYSKMGNVGFTSIGMMGNINGWFVPISIHPICFGVGSIIKKPVVINNNIEIREMLNISILLDHDVIDGANMARFISKLTKNIEKGIGL
jgi:pyruvate/2-oxoglutarate dehydrogenase complex dihydrolipoamide acyltransferase (E2) component